MQQIFQNGRRRKAIPKTASEALLAVKNEKNHGKSIINSEYKLYCFSKCNFLIKLRYCEKTTRLQEIFPLDLTQYYVKSTWKISSNICGILTVS